MCIFAMRTDIVTLCTKMKKKSHTMKIRILSLKGNILICPLKHAMLLAHFSSCGKMFLSGAA